ncbi:hypothetical protein TNCV_3652441 [Trichonephila clavipes]|nr:hypothetical protein TNCV_3652441 [Trichonephila clavipes]
MTTTLILGESFVSDMDWEDTEVRVEEMEWEPSYIQVSKPMDWEDIPQVKASKRSKVSEPVIINIPLQDESVPPQPKKDAPKNNYIRDEEKGVGHITPAKNINLPCSLLSERQHIFENVQN